MRRRGPIAIFVLVLVAALSQGAHGQAAATAPSTGAATTPASGSTAATPSSSSSPSADSLLAGSAIPENPFRRFEIVSLGAFPIMLFYSGFFFDLQRYFANDFNSLYAPWPFQSSTSAPLTDADRYTRIGAALGACAVVGLIDAYLHHLKVAKAERLREATESDAPPQIESPGGGSPAPEP
jgi:hypothetical protein